MNVIKLGLYQQCVDFLAQKRNKIETLINELHTSMTSESKSSAGDKHETGRAMLQLEREKVGNQLKELEVLELTLSKIRKLKITKNISLGSFVVTNSSCYYISISAGVLTIDNKEVYAISMQSPIGKLLLGKCEGDSFEFRGKINKIIEVS